MVKKNDCVTGKHPCRARKMRSKGYCPKEMFGIDCDEKEVIPYKLRLYKEVSHQFHFENKKKLEILPKYDGRTKALLLTKDVLPLLDKEFIKKQADEHDILFGVNTKSNEHGYVNFFDILPKSFVDKELYSLKLLPKVTMGKQILSLGKLDRQGVIKYYNSVEDGIAKVNSNDLDAYKVIHISAGTSCQYGCTACFQHRQFINKTLGTTLSLKIGWRDFLKTQSFHNRLDELKEIKRKAERTPVIALSDETDIIGLAPFVEKMTGYNIRKDINAIAKLWPVNILTKSGSSFWFTGQLSNKAISNLELGVSITPEDKVFEPNTPASSYRLLGLSKAMAKTKFARLNIHTFKPRLYHDFIHKYKDIINQLDFFGISFMRHTHFMKTYLDELGIDLTADYSYQQITPSFDSKKGNFYTMEEEKKKDMIAVTRQALQEIAYKGRVLIGREF